MASKKNFFFCGHTGAVGSFDRSEIVVGEQDLVKVFYVPLGFHVKPVELPHLVPKIALIHEHLPMLSPGCQENYTLAVCNAKGESDFLDRFGIKVGANIAEMREKLNEGNFKLRTAQHKAKESEESLDKQRKKEIERSRSGGFRSGYDRFNPPQDPFSI